MFSFPSQVQLSASGTVSFKGRHLAIYYVHPHALLHLQVRTPRGRLHVNAKGVKVHGNNSRVLTLIGTPGALTTALQSLSLVLGPVQTKTQITLSVTDGHNESEVTITVLPAKKSPQHRSKSH
jgi:hypothetical protein